MFRHLVIPDCQVKPGDDLTHLDWAAQAILDYKPDVIVVIGDFWDLPSLSTHDAPGSKEASGQNVKSDIDAGNEAWLRLFGPMFKEQQRRIDGHRPRWDPRCEFLFGNHENRLERAIFREPKWDGVISLASLETPGFYRNAFLRVVEIDGIKYNHYFPSPHSGRAIGGTIPNRLNHIGGSFTQGHQQGYQYGCKQYPDHVCHGLVCGRFYSRHESYRPYDVQACEWNGIIVKNQVYNADYDVMPLRFDYLRRKYG